MKKNMLVGGLFSVFSTLAWSHPGHAETNTLLSGLLHPLSGMDHLLVMCALGYWAARQPTKQGWHLPVVFMLSMLCASLAAMGWLATSFAELLVMLSVLAMGMLLLVPITLKQRWQVLFVLVIGSAHGYLHGLELGGGMVTMLGMTLTTISLLVLGWVAGSTRKRWINALAKSVGALMMMLGVWALIQI